MLNMLGGGDYGPGGSVVQASMQPSPSVDDWRVCPTASQGWAPPAPSPMHMGPQGAGDAASFVTDAAFVSPPFAAAGLDLKTSFYYPGLRGLSL